MRNIKQIISAEGWRAVFFGEDGSLQIKPVIAWGLTDNKEDEDPQDVDGVILYSYSNWFRSVGECMDDGDIFLGYISPSDSLTKEREEQMLTEGQRIADSRWRRDVTKQLKKNLKRDPTKEEIEAALKDESFVVTT
jgi:hypothetical protein